MAALAVGDWVVTITDDEFNGHFGRVTMLNPVGGHTGYEVRDFDSDRTLTLDPHEVKKLSGRQLQAVMNRYQ